MGPSVRRLKRSLDVLGSLLGLVALAPLLPAVALAIRLDSPGPIFERDVRVGLQRRRSGDGSAARGASRRIHDVHGRLFQLVRFRVPCGKGDGSAPTRVGRVLRHSGIERWPQLWNVLVGDMSLVGPRAASPDLAARLSSDCPVYREAAIGIMPGVFGPSQLHGPETTSFLANVCEKVLFDLHYMTRMRRARPLEALRLDGRILGVCIGRRLSRPRVIGNDVIRFDYPHQLNQVALDVDAFARRTPEGVGAEVHAEGDALVGWWYPPRRRALLLPPGELHWLSGFCDDIQRTESGGLVLHKQLLPGAATAADRLVVELPRALHDVHAVCEHLAPLWEALSERAGDEHLAFRVSFLLIEGLTIVAASAVDRLIVELEIGARELSIRIEEAGGTSGALARLSDLMTARGLVGDGSRDA